MLEVSEALVSSSSSIVGGLREERRRLRLVGSVKCTVCTMGSGVLLRTGVVLRTGVGSGLSSSDSSNASSRSWTPIVSAISECCRRCDARTGDLSFGGGLCDFRAACCGPRSRS